MDELAIQRERARVERTVVLSATAFLAMADRLEALEKVAEAARLSLEAMAMDPCDCMAHRSPPEALRSSLEALGRVPA